LMFRKHATLATVEANRLSRPGAHGCHTNGLLAVPDPCANAIFCKVRLISLFQVCGVAGLYFLLPTASLRLGKFSITVAVVESVTARRADELCKHRGVLKKRRGDTWRWPYQEFLVSSVASCRILARRRQNLQFSETHCALIRFPHSTTQPCSTDTRSRCQRSG
jgi:hypothetical protein